MYRTNRKTRFLLFLSSYLPLWLILTVRAVLTVQRFKIALFVAILFLVFLGGLYWFLKRLFRELSSKEDDVIGIKNFEDVSHKYLEYIIAYIFPLIPERYSLDIVVTLAIIYALIAYLYISFSFIYLNPALAILGLRLYRIKTDKDHEYFLLTKRTNREMIIRIKEKSKIKISVFDDEANLYLEV